MCAVLSLPHLHQVKGARMATARLCCCELHLEDLNGQQLPCNIHGHLQQRLRVGWNEERVCSSAAGAGILCAAIWRVVAGLVQGSKEAQRPRPFLCVVISFHFSFMMNKGMNKGWIAIPESPRSGRVCNPQLCRPSCELHTHIPTHTPCATHSSSPHL